MKKLLLFALLLLPFFIANANSSDSLNSVPIDDSCTCKGKKLYGKVKIVKSGADFIVKVTESAFYDIAVHVSNSAFLDKCGEWYFTESAFYDFSVQFTNSAFYDFSVKFTDSAFYGVKE